MNKQLVELTDPESGARARVSVGQGFNCFSWQPVLEDGPREMLWADAAFDSGEKRPSGSGIPLLFPFPGRIGGAAFTFNGRDYQLEPGDAYGNAIHGFRVQPSVASGRANRHRASSASFKRGG